MLWTTTVARWSGPRSNLRGNKQLSGAYPLLQPHGWPVLGADLRKLVGNLLQFAPHLLGLIRSYLHDLL